MKADYVGVPRQNKGLPDSDSAALGSVQRPAPVVGMNSVMMILAAAVDHLLLMLERVSVEHSALP